MRVFDYRPSVPSHSATSLSLAAELKRMPSSQVPLPAAAVLVVVT